RRVMVVVHPSNEALGEPRLAGGFLLRSPSANSAAQCCATAVCALPVPGRARPANPPQKAVGTPLALASFEALASGAGQACQAQTGLLHLPLEAGRLLC